MAGITEIGGNKASALADSAQAGGASPARGAAPGSDAARLFALEANRAPPAKPASEQEIQKSALKVKELLASSAPNLTFSIDKESGRTVIRVVDPVSHEVLRQIPAEEILRLDRNIDRMIGRLKGLLIDREG